MYLRSYWLLGMTFLTAFIPRSSTSFQPRDISEMLLLPPLGLVSSIGQGNRAVLDPDASVDAAEMLRQSLFRHDEKLKLVGEISVKDSTTRRTIRYRTAKIVGQLQGNRKAAMAQPQPWLDSLLTARHQRYGLASCVWGFTRTAANRRALIARDLGIGLLSMGMVVPLTPNASTRLSVFIYDAQQHAIVYYKTNFPTDKDPLAHNGEIIDREATDLLAKDFGLTE